MAEGSDLACFYGFLIKDFNDRFKPEFSEYNSKEVINGYNI
jgi:hypothetical protein